MSRLRETYYYMIEIMRELGRGEELGVLDLVFRLNTRPETIRRHLEALEAYGFIKTERKPGKKMKIELTSLGACFVRCLNEFSNRKD